MRFLWALPLFAITLVGIITFFSEDPRISRRAFHLDLKHRFEGRATGKQYFLQEYVLLGFNVTQHHCLAHYPVRGVIRVEHPNSPLVEFRSRSGSMRVTIKEMVKGEVWSGSWGKISCG